MNYQDIPAGARICQKCDRAFVAHWRLSQCGRCRGMHDDEYVVEKYDLW